MDLLSRVEVPVVHLDRAYSRARLVGTAWTSPFELICMCDGCRGQMRFAGIASKRKATATCSDMRRGSQQDSMPGSTLGLHPPHFAIIQSCRPRRSTLLSRRTSWTYRRCTDEHRSPTRRGSRVLRVCSEI